MGRIIVAIDFGGLDDVILTGGVQTRTEEEDVAEIKVPETMEEAMMQGGVVTKQEETTLGEDVQSLTDRAMKSYRNSAQAMVEIPLALGTGMAAMSYAGYEAIVAEPEEGLTQTEQIHKRIGDFTYQPEGEYSKVVMKGLGHLGESIVENVKIASDAGYDAATWLGAPAEVAAATGATIQTAGEWFALPIVAKSASFSVKAAVGAGKLVTRPIAKAKEFAGKVKEKAADNLMNDIYNQLATIDGIVESMEMAGRAEKAIPGYRFDLAGGTMSPMVKSISQEVVSKVDTAKIRAENLARSNKEAIAGFVDNIYGKNVIDAPRATIEAIVHKANGSLTEVIKGLADEVGKTETKMSDIRLKMISPKTEHLATAFEAVFEQNLKMNKAFGNALYSKIGDIDISFKNMHEAAVAIAEKKGIWNEGDFPAIIDDIIARGGNVSKETDALIAKKSADLQRMQEMARRDPNFDVNQLTKLSNEVQQLSKQTELTMSFKEMREFDKAVNSAFSIESKGINTRPNAKARAGLLGNIKKEISKSMDDLEKSTDTDVVADYREAKQYWSENVIGKFYTGALKDLMESGDSMTLKAKSYESMVDSVFKAAVNKKAGVRGIQEVLRAIDGSPLGMIALKETIIKKFAKESSLERPIAGSKAGEKFTVIDRNKANKFFEKYSEMLDEVPAIKSMLADESKVIEAIEWQRRNALLRENAVNDSKISNLVQANDPYSSFIAVMKTKNATSELIRDSVRYGVPRESLVRTAVSAIIKQTRTKNVDRSFSLNPEAAGRMLRENEGLKLLLGAEHIKNIEYILRAEEGALFAPKVVHSEKVGTNLITKAEEVLGRSYGSYITDMRAYFQGRTSLRQVGMSGVASMFVRMNKNSELLVKEAAMYDKPLSKHLAEIKRRVDNGDVPSEKLYEATAARLHTLGITKHIFGKVIGAMSEAAPIKLSKGKFRGNAAAIKPAVLAPMYEQQEQ